MYLTLIKFCKFKIAFGRLVTADASSNYRVTFDSPVASVFSQLTALMDPSLVDPTCAQTNPLVVVPVKRPTSEEIRRHRVLLDARINAEKRSTPVQLVTGSVDMLARASSIGIIFITYCFTNSNKP